MRLNFKLILLFTAVTLGANSYAASKTIAVLNPQAAILNSETAKNRLEALRSSAPMKAKLADLERAQARYRELIAKIRKDGALMSQEEMEVINAQAAELRADIEHLATKVRASEERLARDIVEELRPVMRGHVSEIMKKDNIGLLLNAGSVLEMDDGFDITDRVIEMIDGSVK